MVTRSKKITIEQVKLSKPSRGTADDPRDYKKKIGSSMTNNAPTMGLNDAEQRELLANIIGTSPTHQNWNKEVKEYYNNISVEVPYEGMELEIGFTYDDQQAANNKDKGRRTPINISDYVLYRYCLVYSKVANNYEDINKSANISFYISDKALEEDREYDYTKDTNLAMSLYLQLLGDETDMDNVLTVYHYGVEEMSLKVKTLELQKLSKSKGRTDDPTNAHVNKFIGICKDKTLKHKAYIQRCINHGILKRIDNTDTIIYGDNDRIGSSMEAAVLFLTDEANAKLATEIKSKYDHITNAMIKAPVTTVGSEKGNTNADNTGSPIAD